MDAFEFSSVCQGFEIYHCLVGRTLLRISTKKCENEDEKQIPGMYVVIHEQLSIMGLRDASTPKKNSSLLNYF